MDQEILAKIDEIVDAPTLYPEVERKPRERRVQDMIEWYEANNEVNHWYNLYGLDRADAPDQANYLDNGNLRRERWKANSTFYPAGNAFPFDYTLVMRDKLLFENWISQTAQSKSEYVPSICVIRNGELRPRKADGLLGEVQSLSEFLKPWIGQSLVFKQTYGSHGFTVEVVDIEDDKVTHKDTSYSFAEYAEHLSGERTCWIVQEFMKQHPALDKLNASSINCIRMITYSTGSRVVIDADHSILRIGRPGMRTNDMPEGAIPILIDKDGKISDIAYSINPMERIETGLGGYEIPYFQEALDLCVRLHKAIPELFTIGWDVAIGPDGPVIIEGNDGWHPRLVQCYFGEGLRPMWNELMAERQANVHPDVDEHPEV